MRNERGFALIAALWLVVAISALGLEISLSARQRRLAATNRVEAERARAAAEAGIEHARARLERLARGFGPRLLAASDSPFDPWSRPGRFLADTVKLGATRYRVSLRDLGSALNLNRVSEEELKRLLRALGVDFGRADRVAQAIMDWRDSDDEHRARGAERDEYVRLGSPLLPRNGPFQSVGELLFVREMDGELLERVRPHLTVLGTGRVNLNAASREVLLALDGMTTDAVALILRLRQSGVAITNLMQLTRELSPPARRAIEANFASLLSRTSFETREVEATSEAWIVGSPVTSRVEALFARAADQALLIWRRAA